MAANKNYVLFFMKAQVKQELQFPEVESSHNRYSAWSQQSKPESLPTANAHKSGLSWMKKGSSQIFSKQESQHGSSKKMTHMYIHLLTKPERCFVTNFISGHCSCQWTRAWAQSDNIVKMAIPLFSSEMSRIKTSRDISDHILWIKNTAD